MAGSADSPQSTAHGVEGYSGAMGEVAEHLVGRERRVAYETACEQPKILGVRGNSPDYDTRSGPVSVPSRWSRVSLRRVDEHLLQAVRLSVGRSTSADGGCRVLLVIDNYDSFTFNLVQFLGELGADPMVVRNDECTVEEISALNPERIVVSPGPCTPAEAGVSVEVFRRLGSGIPILGVCLGHQALGEAFGGRTVQAVRAMHGKTSPVRHTGAGIFSGIPSPFHVTRYHSLVTEDSALPQILEPIAWSEASEDLGEVQGIKHRDWPLWGVQFHPESHFSEHGLTLLRNFLEMA